MNCNFPLPFSPSPKKEKSSSIGALFSPRSGPCNPDRTAPRKKKPRCGAAHVVEPTEPRRRHGTAAPPPTAARRRVATSASASTRRCSAYSPATSSRRLGSSAPRLGVACSARWLPAASSPRRRTTPIGVIPPPIRYPAVIELKFPPNSTAGGCNQSSALPCLDWSLFFFSAVGMICRGSLLGASLWRIAKARHLQLVDQ